MGKRLEVLLLVVLSIVMSVILTGAVHSKLINNYEIDGAQQDEVVVFIGHPKVKVVVDGLIKAGAVDVPDEKASEFACIIVKEGNTYYWKSRDNYKVIGERWGAYINFERPDRPDYVRIADPSIRGNNVSALAVGDHMMSYDYVEHITMGLTSINYYGLALHDLSTADKSSDVANRPKLSAYQSFRIYAKEGETMKMNQSGKIVEKETVNAFQNGELQFTLLGDEKALLIGNAGTAEVEVIKRESSITFVEKTPSGNKICYDYL